MRTAIVAMVLLGTLVACKEKAEPGAPAARPALDAALAAAAPPPDAAPRLAGSGLPAVFVDGEATWVGGAHGVWKVAHCAGTPDAAGIVAALCKAAPDGIGGADVAGGAGASHAQVLAVLDALKQAATRDLALVTPAALSVPLPGDPARADELPARCGEPPDRCDALRGGPPGKDREGAHMVFPQAAAGGEPRTILVISVSTDGIYVAGQRVAGLAEPGGGPIPGLVERLRSWADAGPAPEVTIEADRGTPAALVTRILDTCRAAGITRMAFHMLKPPIPEPEPPRR